MDKRIENKTRDFLTETFNDLLPKLDEVTEGYHPIWDSREAEIFAELILLAIKMGLLVENKYD